MVPAEIPRRSFFLQSVKPRMRLPRWCFDQAPARPDGHNGNELDGAG